MTNDTSLNWSRRAVMGAGLLAPAILLADDHGVTAQARIAAPMRAADLLSTLGVNTHLRYANGQYNDLSGVEKALSYCGLRHVRDTAISAQAPNAAHYGQLAEAGIRFCLFWGTGRPMADAIGQIAALENAHPGAVEFLEGPNEIQQRFAYAGLTGLAAGQRFMVDMKSAAQLSAPLRTKKLVSFTSFAPTSSVADFANHHPYPKAGAQPGELIRMRRDQWVGSRGAMPGKPMVLTEFGYHTLLGKPARPGHWQGVDEEMQAALLLNGLLDAAAAGIARTYIYQLLDGAADKPAAPSQENHFGLIRFDGTPKPAATALRNLAALIGDTAPHARGFALRPTAMHVTADRAVNVLPLQDASGRQAAVLWQEAPVWDKDASARAPVQPLTVTISSSHLATFSAVIIADNGSAGPRQRGREAHYRIGAQPVLLRIGAEPFSP